MTHPPLADCSFDDSWAVAEGEVDDLPMIVRIRQNLRPLAAHPDLSQRLRIVWEYGNENELGLPSEATVAQMDVCEEALVAAFESDNLAILTHVLTCDGMRQWVYYASDIQECAGRLNDALPHEPPMPIELEVEEDETWSEYLETLDNLDL